MIRSCKVTGAMVVDILSKLPPKSLMRFKCVSKSWNELLNNPGFVVKHLSNATTNKLSSTSFISRRLVPSDTDPEEKREETVFTLVSLCSDYSGDEDNVQFVVEDLNIPLFKGLERLGVLDEPDIISHCHGIICLANFADVILWNPAIREFKLLPRKSLLPPAVNLLKLGFGYDPKSKLYKVVNIVPSDEQNYDDGRLIFAPPKAEVYTQQGAEFWRKIKIDYMETDTSFFMPEDIPLYFNGNCFWLGYEQPKEYECYLDRLEEETKDVIVWFEMGDEVFHHILLPDSLYQSIYTFDMRLLMWNECVGLFGLHKGGFESYGLWVLDNFDVGGSWTKHLTFEPLAGIERALIFWSSEEIIMATASGSLLSYNLETEDLTHFPIHSGGAPGFVAFLCVNSIVPL